jgi:hypothetical protein
MFDDDSVFTAADLKVVSEYVIERWSGALDRDWSVPAGPVDWSCLRTADHTIDCVFSYALFLTSGRQASYPPFGELHALDEAGPADLVEGLRAVSRILWACVTTADPNERAIIRRRPPETGAPNDFAARGGHEMILHASDVCRGLGVEFDPPRKVCERLWRHTSSWTPFGGTMPATGDSWHDLLVRSGRTRVW